MTTDFKALHSQLAPRGSLGRFALAGAFNSAVFYIAWTGSMALLPEVDVRILWGTFWGLTGVLACLLYTSPSPRDRSLSRMPSSA